MPAIKLKKVTAEYLAEKERSEADKAKEGKGKKSLEDVAEEAAAKKDEEEVEEDESKARNFLQVEILFDKRKRTLPVVEQKLVEWLDSNLEKKDDVYLPLMTLYEYYSEVCQMQGENVVDVPVFNRYIRDKFGKFFGFQDNSPYKVLIKERKVKEKKPKVQGETLQIKIRDIITEVIGDLGNPRKGVRFQLVSKAIIHKYPAQRVDIYPKKLRSALERGIYYGYVELVRGVGMCGYYRLPGDPTKEEEEDTKDKKKKNKEEQSSESEEKGKEASENGDASGEGGDKSADEQKDDKDGKEGEAKTEGETDEKRTKKKKKVKKPVKKKPEAWARTQASKHSDPQHVEDSFPLAITYQSDPKEASGNRIRAYIAKFYFKELSHDRLKRALDSGIEKGLWEQTTGSGIGGKFHLLSESFNPGRSGQLSDQISQALVACSEPKQASAGLMKKYITQYHPTLGIEAKPHLFKNALERACYKGVIKQLSGIGAAGSFQLVDQFFPSPNILAGDSSDDESEGGDDSDEEQATEYVPRPTKRGRAAFKPKQAQASVRDGAKAAPARKGRNARDASKKAKKYVDTSEESSEDEVEYKATPSNSRGKSTPKSPSKAPPNKATPKKATPKKATPKKAAPKKATPKQQTTKKPATDRQSRFKPNYAEDDSDDEFDMITEYDPQPSKSRDSRANARATNKPPADSSKKRKATKRPVEVVSESEEEEEVAPPKKARGAAKKAAVKIVEIESGSEEEEVIETKKSKAVTPAKGAKGSPTKKSPAKKSKRRR